MDGTFVTQGATVYSTTTEIGSVKYFYIHTHTHIPRNNFGQLEKFFVNSADKSLARPGNARDFHNIET